MRCFFDFSLDASSGAMGFESSTASVLKYAILLDLKVHDSTRSFEENQNKVILAIRLLNSRSKVNLTTSVASMAPSVMMTSTPSMILIALMASLTSKKQKIGKW